MNALEIVAFAVAALVCVLPGIMAWNHHFGAKKTSEEKQVLRHASTKPATGKVY